MFALRLRRYTLLAAAATAGLALPAQGAGPADTVLHQRDSGRTIVLHTRDRLIIRLKERATRGYSGRKVVYPAPEVLRLGQESLIAGRVNGSEGSPAVRELEYTPIGKGVTSLKLAYMSPRGQRKGTFKLKVRVTR